MVAIGGLETPDERYYGQHWYVGQNREREAHGLVGADPGERGAGRQDGQASVQARDLRVRQAIIDQPLVVVRAMRGIPAFAAQHASRQRNQAVEQERGEDDYAELDWQSSAADAKVAEQAQPGESEAQKRAANVAHE